LTRYPAEPYSEIKNFIFLYEEALMLYKEDQPHMALVRLKRAAQITLPAELRKKFNLEEGDYLEIEAVEEGILLRPVSVLDQHQARKALRELLDRVHAHLPLSEQDPKAQEEEITRVI
jgi:AbrB family looped-hinge helix DNA binding protein